LGRITRASFVDAQSWAALYSIHWDGGLAGRRRQQHGKGTGTSGNQSASGQEFNLQQRTGRETPCRAAAAGGRAVWFAAPFAPAIPATIAPRVLKITVCPILEFLKRAFQHVRSPHDRGREPHSVIMGQTSGDPDQVRLYSCAFGDHCRPAELT